MSNYETTVISMPINDGLQAKVEKLSAEGWQQLPGTEALAVYYLMRVKGAQPLVRPTVEGKMIIDDSKVFIKGANGDIRQY